jgi:hypothetical protein
MFELGDYFVWVYVYEVELGVLDWAEGDRLTAFGELES